jgi:hypothetical protein
MAISINQTQSANSRASQTAQIESGSYTQKEKSDVGKTPVPVHMQVSEIHRAKRKKNYYAWILDLLTRETSSDLRKKVFGSDPLQ